MPQRTYWPYAHCAQARQPAAWDEIVLPEATREMAPARPSAKWDETATRMWRMWRGAAPETAVVPVIETSKLNRIWSVKLFLEGWIERDASLRDFWRFGEALDYLELKTTNIVIVNGDSRQRAPKVFLSHSDADHIEIGWQVTTQTVVSLRERLEIVNELLAIFEATAQIEDVSIFELRSVFTQKLRARAKIRVVTYCEASAKEAPSTHCWVHGFTLWTGVSPPKAVPHASVDPHAVSGSQPFEENNHVSDFRSNSCRNRKRRVDRRIAIGNSQRNSPHCAFFCRIPQCRRYQRIRPNLGTAERPPSRSCRRQVGYWLRTATDLGANNLQLLKQEKSWPEKPELQAPSPTPGEVLKEHIVDARKITQEALAEAMGVSRLTINQLINGKRSVTAEMALRLARVLDTTPDFWLNLQRRVDLAEAQR